MQYEKVIAKSLKFIDENLDGHLTLNSIAFQVGYSSFHFSRIFKQHMGISLMDYVKKRRLIKASNEIIEGKRIIDAALDSGYQSSAGFTKAFRKEFGFSPVLLKTMVWQIESLGGHFMEQRFLAETEIGISKEELFRILQSKICKSGEQKNLEIKKVYELACDYYSGQKRYSGEEYITHPLNVAILLADLEADETVITAGMLCDVLKKTSVTKERLQSELPQELYSLVVQINEWEFSQVSIPKDDRILIVLLAERLHNMRTLEYMKEERRREKAEETIKIFMPFAVKLGNRKLLMELNELSMKYV